MNNSENTHLVNKPYKGMESYQIEDSELFFGRDDASAQLTAKILSSRLTLLHAQSGAGKTSLLNARIMADLESKGWTPVRILPQDDPVKSTLAATVQYALPSPKAELEALDRISEHLVEADEDPTLDDILKRYDNLPVNNAQRRKLVSPVKTESLSLSDLPIFSSPTMPYICRVLNSSVDVDTFNAHLNAICGGNASGDAQVLEINNRMRINQLKSLLSDSALEKAYIDLISQLDVPLFGLVPFFTTLFEIYGVRRRQFSLILIFDQFEELFTRFVDPGPVFSEHMDGMPDWRLRWEFFSELEKLYTFNHSRDAHLPSNRQTRDNYILPIRYVISMRSEYIAQLDPLRRFIFDLEASSCHLRLLTTNEATAAIKTPAESYGYGYSDRCYDRLIAELTKEERFVEPAHLQIVCEKLWNDYGAELCTDGVKSSGNELPEIPLEAFEKLHGIKGILKSYLGDFLSDLDRAQRLETLEILEPLITSGGTRNIMERDQLINAPFRIPVVREKLLSNLVNHAIVRIERRLGGFFIEITHEFLIGPILETLRDELYKDPDYARYRNGLYSLERFRHIDFRKDTDSLLIKQEFWSLHDNREKIIWNDWSCELMFRSAIVLGLNHEAVREWAMRYKNSGDTEQDPNKNSTS